MNLSKPVNPIRNYAVGSVITALILLGPVVTFLMVIAAQILIDLLTVGGTSAVCAVAAGSMGLVLSRKFWPRSEVVDQAEPELVPGETSIASLEMGTTMKWLYAVAATTFLCLAPQLSFATDSGLITKESKHSVSETAQKFESAVNDKSANGWMVFTEIDHAAAAEKNGLKLRPRTVIVYGNPKIGTASMQKAPTVAIDVPLKALVWEDDQGKVWLTYNSAEYIQDYVYPRHGLPSNPDAAKATGSVLADFAQKATD